MEKLSNEEHNSMVNTNTMLLSFEGWIKYIEGFSRGLQTTKTVDAGMVFDCVGEIMEYMKQLKGQICQLLIHCEQQLIDAELKDTQSVQLQQQCEKLLQENEQLKDNINTFSENITQLKDENDKLRQAITILKEKADGKM
jgi:predicted nuclease with TOPRIM domain